MECEVAREALSARIDGEREPVPATRVDEHLDECAQCRRWFERVSAQASLLKHLAAGPAPVAVADRTTRRRWPVPSMAWHQWSLLAVGVAQLVLGAAQAFGSSLGLAHHHGMAPGGHLLNESTAWSVALGLVMIVAAVRPAAAAGLAGVLSAFAVVLTVYVVSDISSGAVTVERLLTHVPVVVGALLAFLVWRRTRDPRPSPHAAADVSGITLPYNASRGRRRGHLWSTDGAA